MVDGYTPTRACRSCGSDALADVLDLGEQPLANAFREPGDASEEPRFPLGVVVCTSCTLLQLSGTVDPLLMFTDYPYLSSTSSTFSEAARALAHRTIDGRALDERHLVVEIGSNDGYLLRHYAEQGVQVLGVDPAANIADIARNAGVETLTAFFGATVAEKVRADLGPAAVVHANNVVAHVPDPNDLFAGIAHLLADDGVALVESPHVLALLDRCEFDTVYHEHVFHWSLSAMDRLAAQHGLIVGDVEVLPVHGGSLRYHLTRRAEPSATVERVRADEAARALATPGAYDDFVTGTARVRRLLPEFLSELRTGGAHIGAYGAAAKGTVLLNACDLGPDVVEFVADKNPLKQGRLMPGVAIPIVDASALTDRQPDIVLLLAWNLVDEIRGQQRDYLSRGGRFAVPIPEPRLVEPELVES